jgi:hypothetical protein
MHDLTRGTIGEVDAKIDVMRTAGALWEALMSSPVKCSEGDGQWKVSCGDTTVGDYVAHILWVLAAFTSGAKYPVLKTFLQFSVFAERFRFVDDLLGFLLELRKKFAERPAVLGVILMCTTLDDGDSVGLFDLNWGFENCNCRLLKEESRKWPCGLNSYMHIMVILNDFVNEYNRFLEVLGRRGGIKLVEERYDAVYSFMPHMTISHFAFESFLGPLLFDKFIEKTKEGDHMECFGATEDVLRNLIVEAAPRRLSVLSDACDFLGLSTDDWERAFCNIPHWVGDMGKYKIEVVVDEIKVEEDRVDMRYSIIAQLIQLYWDTDPADWKGLFGITKLRSLKYGEWYRTKKFYPGKMDESDVNRVLNDNVLGSRLPEFVTKYLGTVADNLQ